MQVFFLLGPLKRAVSFSIRTIMKKKLYLLPHCLCIRALVWNIKINHNVIVDAVIVNAWQKMWNHRKFELLVLKSIVLFLRAITDQKLASHHFNNQILISINGEPFGIRYKFQDGYFHYSGWNVPKMRLPRRIITNKKLLVNITTITTWQKNMSITQQTRINLKEQTLLKN